MFGALRTFVKEHIVDEVPDDMFACLDCGNVECRDSRYENCPNRLAKAAALRVIKDTPAFEGD